MLPFNKLLLRMMVAAVMGVAVVVACGPFFGIETLPNRAQVLLASPTISFQAELETLVPKPQDPFPVVESQDENRTTLEAKELSSAELTRVTTMWNQNGGDAAYAVGEGLPAAVRLYTAGAVSFLQAQPEIARKYLQAVFAIPNEERRRRDLWAHFTLGRLAVQEGNQGDGGAV